MAHSAREAIETRLREAFEPFDLSVIDESHLHAGHHHGESAHHTGFNGSPGTHFRVRLVSEAFANKTRIERHRAVNAVLAEPLASGVHALAIEALAPGEPSRRG